MVTVVNLLKHQCFPKMKYSLSLLVISFLLFPACKAPENKQPAPKAETSAALLVPDWAKNANIYEVNLRQYTPEGTIKAFVPNLHRLKDMGVDILWFMPIYPVSKLKAKGSMGSSYAAADFTAVNPDYGTLAEFQAMVDSIHALGMKIILDWVPNHSGWDNHWITEHPDWYTHDAKTDTIIHPKGTDWTDVADLNYDNPALRKGMTDALKFWLTEGQVDGFRCDVACEVPDDYWADARKSLDSVRTIFMLAECGDNAEQMKVCFNMNYGWPFNGMLVQIARGAKVDSAFAAYQKWDDELFPPQAYHMTFITNHDENTWNNQPMLFGAGEDAFAVVAFTYQGMPLIYSGQESGLKKSIQFFEKDQVDWGTYAKAGFYTTLLKLKHQHPALWNGTDGGKAQLLANSQPAHVLSFTRAKDNDQVVVVVNLSDKAQTVTVEGEGFAGDYADVFSGKKEKLSNGMQVALAPWGYKVWAK